MKHTSLLLCAGLLIVSCGQEFLDIRRDANQVVPSMIEDYQAILDNNSVMNQTSFGLSMIGGGEFSVSDEVLKSFSSSNIWQRNAYLWLSDVFEGAEASDWNNPYQRILYANLALDVTEITPTPQLLSEWNTVRGQALFHRAWNYFQLAQTFCDNYKFDDEQDVLGLPLRLEYDVTAPITRQSLRETYGRILMDLEEAINLLPEVVVHQFQPSKAAGHALLARVYLYTGDYVKAEHAASLALAYGDELLDFNLLDWNQQYSFSNYAYGDNNPEVIFHSHNTVSTIMANNRMNVDSALFHSYSQNDLRSVIYYDIEADGRVSFKGSYQGGGAYFTGLASDELFLIKAECAVRQGDLFSAQSYLNRLLQKRYITGTFVDIDFSEMADHEALTIILNERRKELYMRGTRWGDLKRLNTDSRFAISLEREFEGRKYTLQPNETNWSFPIPDNEIELH